MLCAVAALGEGGLDVVDRGGRRGRHPALVPIVGVGVDVAIGVGSGAGIGAEFGVEVVLPFAERRNALAFAFGVEASVFDGAAGVAQFVEFGVEFGLFLAGLLDARVGLGEVGFGLVEGGALVLDPSVEVGSVGFEFGEATFEGVERVDLPIEIAFLAFEPVDFGLERVGIDRTHNQLA